jgi:hypothetical protein
MRTFRDTASRTWKLDLTIGAMNRVKTELGLDLLAPHEKPGEQADQRARSLKFKGRQALLVSVLNYDASLLFDVIYQIIKPQLDEQNVSVESFVESMGGGSAYDAYKAFSEEWADFFRNFHRPDAARMVEKHRVLIEAEAVRDEKMVDKISDAVERKMAGRRARLEQRLAAVGNGPTSMSSPASSESTRKT